MKYRRRLLIKNHRPGEEIKPLLAAAIKENVAWHRTRNPEYARLLTGMGFPEASFDRISQLPILTTAFLKKHPMNTLSRAPYVAHSSGTSGLKSAIPYSPSDVGVLLLMSIRAMGRRGLFSPKPVNYVMLGYQYHKSNQAQTMRTAYLATLMAPSLKKSFALRYREGGYHQDLEGLLADMSKFSRSAFPCRIVGFPSYLYFVLQLMEERDLRLNMPKDSKILLGGGWKQFYREEVEKESLYRLVRERLGIEEKDIIEVFGVVEHPVIYCDCEKHHFHVPPYSRVIIRDPESLKPLPMGQPGLMHFVSPVLKGSPVVSLMTDDIGILHDGAGCGCGNSAPYFTVLGRAGMTEIKTCVQGANEYFQEAKL